MSFIPAIPLLLIYPIEAQLTLEQYGFELCGSLTGFFFFFFCSKYCSSKQSVVVEPADTEEPQM